MKRHKQLILRLKDKRGVSAIMVALMAFVLFGLGAVTVDIGHIFMVRNQLKNAADAGALAGARVLHNVDGTVNTGANQTAFNAATANVTEGPTGPPVEVNWAGGGNIGTDVERGHWCFATSTFTPSDVTDAPVLFNRTFQQLDTDLTFINAVRVNTRRQQTPVGYSFARILGQYTNFIMSLNSPVRDSRSVAYIGFAGTLGPGDVDQPIAICRESILGPNGEYQCNVGRMITSGLPNHQTGGWTDFNQDNPCAGGTNAPTVRSLVCGSGNTDMLKYGKDMATSGGQIESAFKDLVDCWEKMTGKTQLWNLTLPVVICPSNNVGTCEELRGAVNLNIVWINDQNDPHYDNVPTQMQGIEDIIASWSCTWATEAERIACWDSFVAHFNLRDVDGSLLSDRPEGDHGYIAKTIYFLPDCTEHKPTGNTGGDPFGVLARIPVLVQ